MHHKPYVNIEMRQEGQLYQIVALDNEERLIYEGPCRLEAEAVLMHGFQYHFAEEYILETTEQSKQEILLITHRVIENLYMRVLISLGFNVMGKWEVTSYYRQGIADRVVDEVSIKLSKREESNRVKGLV
jgi:hypothetical protein